MSNDKCSALLGYAYRRLNPYDKCLEICNIANLKLNNPSKIKTQVQWCLVFRDIINEDCELEAFKTINALNLKNKYDARIIKFICNHFITIYTNAKDFDNVIVWMEKLKIHIL